MIHAIPEHSHWKSLDDADVPDSQYHISQCPHSNKTLQTLLKAHVIHVSL